MITPSHQYRVFGAMCTKCSKQIQRDDLVHRVEDKVGSIHHYIPLYTLKQFK